MNNNTLLNRMFSRKMLNDIIKTSNSEIYIKTVRKYIQNPEEKTNACVISEIYEKLNKEYRNEYFYKNTLLNKILVDQHKIDSTVALTEIPIANSIVDMLMINGVAKVYEIKTELDTFNRLYTQISDYYKAFDHVSIVTSVDKIQKLEKILNEIYIQSFEKNIGLFVINEKSELITIRKPTSYNQLLDKKTIFNILRKKEYEKLLIESNIELPNVSQFEYYTKCYELFKQISIDEIYEKFIKILKKRVEINQEIFVKLPQPIREVVYFSNVKDCKYETINKFLYENYVGG